MSDFVRTSPEVAEALLAGRPVVALETAVLTHGLPRLPLPAGREAPGPGWDASVPVHLETVRAMQRCVRSADAVPAVIGVHQGILRIGLSDHELEELAHDSDSVKVSSPALSGMLGRSVNAGTTVSATLVACGLARPDPIRILATGGIGGVHPSWTQRLDVSADLRQLSTQRVCVVSSGAKSILDVAATLELLEALGVPVVGIGGPDFARFICRGDDTLRCHATAETPREVARFCEVHWRAIRSPTAVLVSNPVPEAYAMESATLAGRLAEIEAQAEAAGLRGAGRTPFVLRRLVEATDGRALTANLALLLNNAGLAARISLELERTGWCGESSSSD